jgi:hypothetical protein
MPKRDHAYKASQILSTIGAIVKQLETWDKTQERFAVRRAAANVNAVGGRAQRILDAHHRAQVALGTQFVLDPPCEECGSITHLTDECDVKLSRSKEVPEKPSAGIHRAIVYRLLDQARNLICLLYPSFYCGTLTFEAREGLEAPFSKLSGPDYQAIGITSAARDVLLTTGFRNESRRSQRAATTPIARSYFSLAFPLDFIEFRDRVIEVIDQALEDEIKAK